MTEELRRLTAGRGNGTDASFEAGNPFLERGDRRVADPRVDVAELLQREQIRGVRQRSRRRSWWSGRSEPLARR
jgi:hypothetical protein